MVKRTHLDRLLDRKAITKKDYTFLRDQETALRKKDEHDALELAKTTIDKAAMPNVKLRGAALLRRPARMQG